VKERAIMDQSVSNKTAILGGKLVPTVDSRELHTVLKVQTRHNDWMERRLEGQSYEKSLDYAVLKIEYGANSNRGFSLLNFE
jgi:phage anti-repressor protein